MASHGWSQSVVSRRSRAGAILLVHPSWSAEGRLSSALADSAATGRMFSGWMVEVTVEFLIICLEQYLLGGLEHEFYNFPYIGNSNPTDFHIFQRGWNMLKPPTKYDDPSIFQSPLKLIMPSKSWIQGLAWESLGWESKGAKVLAWTTNAKWAEVLKLSPGLFCFHPRNLT